MNTDQNQNETTAPDGAVSELTQLLAKASIGDTFVVEVQGDNGAELREYDIIAEDKESIAVPGVASRWWFYRDTGDAYIGNARIVSAG